MNRIFRVSALKHGAILVVLGGLLALTSVFGGPRPTSAHDIGYSCYPNYWNTTPPDNEISQIWLNVAPMCGALPAGAQYQTSGYTPHGYWYYMQHNSDEYVQEQINGPWCGSDTTWPSDANCGTSWYWWTYWQRNPNGWKQQQINTWAGGPNWTRMGVF